MFLFTIFAVYQLVTVVRTNYAKADSQADE